MYIVVITLTVIASILMIGVVLIQKSKGGGLAFYTSTRFCELMPFCPLCYGRSNSGGLDDAARTKT